MKHTSLTKYVWQVLSVFLLMASVGVIYSDVARAHGERNQEPFLRMRTFHWYDVKFSKPEGTDIPVNGEVEITGTVHAFTYWPEQISGPSTVYFNAASAGAVFVKLEAWVNEKPAIQSFKMELGRDYNFKVKLKARWPGKWHVHPMVNVLHAGGLLGPGMWFNVTGDQNDFALGVKTLTGREIPNLATWGVSRVITWHTFWAVLALVWLIWWIKRPLLLPRWLMVHEETNEDELVTKGDRVLAAVLLVGTLGACIAGYIVTEKTFPRTITLQAGKAIINPLPKPPAIPVDMSAGEYHIPGRTVIAKFKVTNTADSPIQLGEFTSAGLRFIEKSVQAAVDNVDPGYPEELLPGQALKVSDNSPLAPGETRVITVEATDAAWETERLSSLLKDPESTLGALLFFYDENGKRYMSELFGTLIPIFKR